MSISLTVPDLSSTNSEVDKYLGSFGVSKQSDGKGGYAYMATLSVNVYDSNGNVYKQASYSRELLPTEVTSIRNFIVNNFLPGLKQQEGV